MDRETLKQDAQEGRAIEQIEKILNYASKQVPMWNRSRSSGSRARSSPFPCGAGRSNRLKEKSPVLNMVIKDSTIINSFDRRRIHSVSSEKTKELFGIVYVIGNLKSKTWQRGRSDRNLYSIGQGS